MLITCASYAKKESGKLLDCLPCNTVMCDSSMESFEVLTDGKYSRKGEGV